MSQVQIEIELSSRQLFLTDKGVNQGVYPVAIGKPATPTPTGDFRVLNKIMNPGGGLGTRWMQFTGRQHGIHGTNKPWLIGQAVSNGCVRMYNSDVEVVYARVKVNTPVIIRHHIQTTGKYPGNLSSTIYTVKKGDSLWSISLKFNTTVGAIKQLNNLKSNLIYPGQKLKIPG